MFKFQRSAPIIDRYSLLSWLRADQSTLISSRSMLDRFFFTSFIFARAFHDRLASNLISGAVLSISNILTRLLLFAMKSRRPHRRWNDVGGARRRKICGVFVYAYSFFMCVCMLCVLCWEKSVGGPRESSWQAGNCPFPFQLVGTGRDPSSHYALFYEFYF